MKIIEVNYGLASIYNNEIEINHKLQGELKDKILKHELRHTRNRQYTTQDFKNDFQSENSYFWESLKFSIINFEAFIGFFPLMYSYYYKEMTFNKTAIFPFLYFGIIFALVLGLTIKANIFVSFIGYSLFFITANLLLLLITHIKVKKDIGFIYKTHNS